MKMICFLFNVFYTNKLFRIPLLDMTEFRQEAEAVVLNKKIFVIGGRDFKGERVLDSIECFDISEGEWSRLTSIPIPREGFRCVTCRVSRDYLTPVKLKWLPVSTNILKMSCWSLILDETGCRVSMGLPLPKTYCSRACYCLVWFVSRV